MEERLIHQDDKRQYQCTLLVSMLVVMCFWTDRSSSNHNLVDRLALLEPAAVAAVGLRDAVLVLLLVASVALAVS